jgi:hypothetical protein
MPSNAREGYFPLNPIYEEESAATEGTSTTEDALPAAETCRSLSRPMEGNLPARGSLIDAQVASLATGAPPYLVPFL